MALTLSKDYQNLWDDVLAPSTADRPKDGIKAQLIEIEGWRDNIEESYGQGAADWLKTIVLNKGSKEALDTFLTLYKDDLPKDSTQIVKWLFENKFFPGTQSLKTLTDALNDNSKIGLSIYQFVMLEVCLNELKDYLCSDEFKNLPKEEKLLSLVYKALELNLPLESENLSQIFSALPSTLPGGVKKADIHKIDLPLRSAEAIRNALNDDSMKDYLSSSEFKNQPKEEKLLSLVYKALELNLPLESENLSQIFSALLSTLPGGIKKADIHKINLPLRSAEAIRNALNDDSMKDYLSSDEFKNLPKEEKLLSLVYKAIELNLPLESENLSQIFSALPSTLPGGVKKADIQVINLPLRSAEAIRNALNDDSMKDYLSSDEFKNLPKEEKLLSLVYKAIELNLPLESENLSQIFSALPSTLPGGVKKADIHKIDLPLRSAEAIRNALNDDSLKDYLCSDEFKNLPKEEKLLSLVYKALELNLPLESENLSQIFSALPNTLPGGVKKADIHKIDLPLRSAEAIRNALNDDSMKDYLSSSEFKNQPKEEKLLSLVYKALELNLPLESENLSQIFSALPSTLPGGVKKADIQVINLPLRSAEAIRNALNDDSLKDYLCSDEFKNLPKEEKLLSLVYKAIELNLPLESENLSQIFSALPSTLPGGVKKADIQVINLPLRSAEAIRNALNDDSMKDYLSSSEFKNQPKEHRLEALKNKLEELLQIKMPILGLYTALPSNLNGKAKNDLFRAPS